MQRYLILACAFLLQSCLGATYAWGVFVPQLREARGLSQAITQAPFTVFFMAFPATMLLSSRLMARWGMSGCAQAGAVLFGGGWILASLGHFHFAFTVLGIGLVAGIGVGMAYLVPISVGMLWFPKQKGLVTGVAVAGFGGGAIAVSQIAEHLLQASAENPFPIFTVFGICFALIGGLAGRSLQRPPGAGLPDPGHMPKDALAQRLFHLLYLAMFSGLAAGFVINTNLKQLSGTDAGHAGVIAIGLFAAANAAGRLSWGALADRLPIRTALRANLLGQALTILLGLWVLGLDGLGLKILALLAGFHFGGIFVLYAATAAQAWGANRAPNIYSWLFSSNIIAATTPMIAGWVYDHTGGFTTTLYVLAALLVATAIALPQPPTAKE